MRHLASALVLSIVLAPLPAFAAAASSDNEVRLEARLLSASKTKAEEEYEIKDADASETTQSDEWDASSAFPLLGVMAYSGGLALGAQLAATSNSFTFATLVGAKPSKTMEVGGLLSLAYSSEKREEKAETAAGKTETKSHDATRDLGLGPYLRITVPTGSGKLEIMPALQYLRHQEDSSGTFGDDSEEKTGYGLHVEAALVMNLNKNLQYFGALGLGYVNYSSGEKVDRSGTTKTESKLEKDTETSFDVTPLGLRLIL